MKFVQLHYFYHKILEAAKDIHLVPPLSKGWRGHVLPLNSVPALDHFAMQTPREQTLLHI